MLWRAAKAWGGYTLSSFQREDAVTQGWVLADYLINNHREGYEMGMQKAAARRKADKKAGKDQEAHPVYRYRESILRERLEAERRKGS